MAQGPEMPHDFVCRSFPGSVLTRCGRKLRAADRRKSPPGDKACLTCSRTQA